MSGVIVRRNTLQRQLVLDVLLKCRSHLTASELYSIARQHLPSISLGTVYRNLEFLARKGVIRKVEIPGHEARFDCETGNHHHIRCVRCGELIDAEGLSIDIIGLKGDPLGGYEIIDYRLEVLGICPACKGKLTKDQAGS